MRFKPAVAALLQPMCLIEIVLQRAQLHDGTDTTWLAIYALQ